MIRTAVMAVALLLGSYPLAAREVTVTFWISGGAEGILDGGRIAPGWLGLISFLGDRPDEEAWIDVGGTRHAPELAEIPNLRLPEAVVPGEALLRLMGASFIQEPLYLGTNLGFLPQFPDVERGFQSVITMKHPDGGQIQFLGLLSEQTPLRVPSNRLIPLRVLPVTESVRNTFLSQQETGTLSVLALPEGMNGPEASRLFPDAQILVEPPRGAAQVVEVAQGTRLRVRPGRHGRSVIRAWARWNTVTKTFSNPRAEVVWVQPVEYESLTLPGSVKESLRDRSVFSPAEVADVWWKPKLKPVKEATLRPDGVRAQRVPEDDGWMVAEVPAEQWKSWKKVEGERWTSDLERIPRQPRVAFPAAVAAGRGNWNCPIRQDLVKGVVRAVELDHTLRDGVAVTEPSSP